jgi:hypothetical protein
MWDCKVLVYFPNTEVRDILLIQWGSNQFAYLSYGDLFDCDLLILLFYFEIHELTRWDAKNEKPQSKPYNMPCLSGISQD